MSQSESLALIERGERLEVRNRIEYEIATDYLKGATALERRIAEHYAPAIQNAHALHKSLIEQSLKQRSPILNIIARVKGLLVGFQNLERKKAETERAKLQAKADKAAAKNGIEAPVIQFRPDIPSSEGMSSRVTWRCEVVDASLVPREYMIPDQPKLNELARRMKEKFAVEGCRVIRDETVVIRGV